MSSAARDGDAAGLAELQIYTSRETFHQYLLYARIALKFCSSELFKCSDARLGKYSFPSFLHADEFYCREYHMNVFGEIRIPKYNFKQVAPHSGNRLSTGIKLIT